MAEFTPINTQEEFDAMIKSRLEREATKVRSEYADYESIKNTLAEKTKKVEELTGKIGELENQKADLSSKLSASETGSAKTRIAYEMGLPYELSTRLNGGTEDEIRKDAESLKQLIRQNQPAQPVFTPERNPNTDDAALKKLAESL